MTQTWINQRRFVVIIPPPSSHVPRTRGNSGPFPVTALLLLKGIAGKEAMDTTWNKLRKQFSKLATEEVRLDPIRGFQASADLFRGVQAERRDSIDYAIFGGDDYTRERCISVVTRAGIALGAASDVAVVAWLEHVIRDAIAGRWREWCSIPQRREDIVRQDTGVLDFFCRASATSCELLARQAIVTAVQVTPAKVVSVEELASKTTQQGKK